MVKMVKNKDDTSVSNNLKYATKKDKMMMFLMERILRDWKKYKNSFINQFYSVRGKLHVIDDTTYMNNS